MSITIAPAAQSILDQATALWPHRSRASDGTLGDAAHAARDSDHNPDSRGVVHAADLTNDPANGCDAHAQADRIRLRARAGQEPRLKYVISNRRIASPSSGWEWVAYDGSNPHEHHAHFSVNSGAIENDTSPWFTEGDDLMGVGDEILEHVKEVDRKTPGVAQQRRDRAKVTSTARTVKASADLLVEVAEAVNEDRTVDRTTLRIARDNRDKLALLLADEPDDGSEAETGP